MEEATQDSYYTGVKLAHKTRTLELQSESKRFSSSLVKQKEKPLFLSKLSPVAAIVGETAMFSVAVSGFPKLAIQWFHNGQTITSSSVYTLVHERDEYGLVIHKVQKELEGEYSCTVSNMFGHSTCTSYLHVQVKEPEKNQRVDSEALVLTGKPPEFTQTIESLELCEGGQAFFRYFVTGDPLPEVQWLNGSFSIQPSRFWIIVSNPDGSGFINILSVKEEHNGVYTCKASNQHGEASCTAELLVFPVKVQKEQTFVKETKTPEIFMTLQTTEYQKRTLSDQMIYTISTEDRQIIPSEEVGTLRELDISAATLQREQLTHKAAVLQAHELQENVYLASSQPPQVLAIPVKQLHMATFLSSVQERQKIPEQHSERILSPEVIELRLATEQTSKVMSATSEEVLLLGIVRAEALTDQNLEHGNIMKEPRQLVSGHQVKSTLPILDAASDVTHRPEEERGFNVKEGVKILYSAQSEGQVAITERHSDSLQPLDTATQPLIDKEQSKPVVAPVSETTVALSKEQMFEIQQPEQESISFKKDVFYKSAVAAEEKYKVRAEPAGQPLGLATTMCLEPQHEGETLLNLQVISEQDVLQSEGRFSNENPSVEHAEARKSPTLLHSVTQAEQRTIICEVTSEFSAKNAATLVQSKKELPPTKYIQSIQLVSVLSKEGVLTVTKPDQQMAKQKQYTAKRHAATSEERKVITADSHSQDLHVSVTGVRPQVCTEPKPSSMPTVFSQTMQLQKETPFVIDVQQQRAVVKKEDYCNITHSLNVTDTHSLEEGHTTILKTDEKFQFETKVEPKIPKRTVFIEKKAIANDSCTILEAARQDFAVQIQEGQSVRQSALLKEMQVIMGEQSSEIHKRGSSTVSIVMQHKDVLSVHESRDSLTLPKELHFVIQIPELSSVNIHRQLSAALQSAVARDQPVLLADVVRGLQAVEVQEVRVQKEPRQATATYLITTQGSPMEITLSFEGQYHQTAGLMSELRVALHAMVFQEQQSLTSELPGTVEKDQPQRALLGSAPSKGVLSSVVETKMVEETAAGFPPAESQSVVFPTEASFQSTSVHSRPEICESMQVKRTTVRLEQNTGATEVTIMVPVVDRPVEQCMEISVRSKNREEFLSEAIMISESSDGLVDYPAVIDPLEDVCTEEKNMVVFTTTIKYVTQVTWLFNGQLVTSGKEFKCSKDQHTFTLVIDKVVKERHQGEYVCEAENEAGRTTTSAHLTVVSRGLMMDNSLISSTNLTPC